MAIERTFLQKSAISIRKQILSKLANFSASSRETNVALFIKFNLFAADSDGQATSFQAEIYCNKSRTPRKERESSLPRSHAPCAEHEPSTFAFQLLTSKPPTARTKSCSKILPSFGRMCPKCTFSVRSERSKSKLSSFIQILRLSQQSPFRSGTLARSASSLRSQIEI